MQADRSLGRDAPPMRPPVCHSQESVRPWLRYGAMSPLSTTPRYRLERRICLGVTGANGTAGAMGILVRIDTVRYVQHGTTN